MKEKYAMIVTPSLCDHPEWVLACGNIAVLCCLNVTSEIPRTTTSFVFSKLILLELSLSSLLCT